MVVDVSHVSDSTFFDVVEISEDPVIFPHSGVSPVHDHRRNVNADMYPRKPSPVEIRGVQDYPDLTRGLKARGYSDEEVKKIMGGNLLRVWKQVTG